MSEQGEGVFKLLFWKKCSFNLLKEVGDDLPREAVLFLLRVYVPLPHQEEKSLTPFTKEYKGKACRQMTSWSITIQSRPLQILFRRTPNNSVHLKRLHLSGRIDTTSNNPFDMVVLSIESVLGSQWSSVERVVSWCSAKRGFEPHRLPKFPTAGSLKLSACRSVANFMEF